MFISDAKMDYNGHEEFATKIEKLMEKQGLMDVLCILVRAAIDRIFRIKDENERLRAGALFLKEFELLYTLTRPSRRGKTAKVMPNKQRRPPSLGTSACIKEDGRVATLKDTESLMLQLGDLPATMRYKAIMQGAPEGIGLILRDYPKDRDRDQFVLETIACAVAHRSNKKAPEAVTEIASLKLPLRRMTDKIAAISDDKVRNAAILEEIHALTDLGKVVFGRW